MLSLSKHEDANQKPVILRQAQDKDWAFLIIWSTHAWLRVVERFLGRLCFEERLERDLHRSENHASFRWSGRGGDRGRFFETVDGETKARLSAVFLENAVLVIREQDLSVPQLLEAVQLFAEVFRQHNTRFSLPECPLFHYLSN